MSLPANLILDRSHFIALLAGGIARALSALLLATGQTTTTAASLRATDRKSPRL